MDPIKELEEAHLFLDGFKVPRTRDDNGATNSLKTRIDIAMTAQRIVLEAFRKSAGLGDVSAEDILGPPPEKHE